MVLCYLSSYHCVKCLVFLLQLVYDALETLELSIKLADALLILLEVALRGLILLYH